MVYDYPTMLKITNKLKDLAIVDLPIIRCMIQMTVHLLRLKCCKIKGKILQSNMIILNMEQIRSSSRLKVNNFNSHVYFKTQ